MTEDLRENLTGDEALIEVEIDRGVAILRMNAPKRLNALSPQMLNEFNSKLEALTQNDSVRAVVLTGAGRAFCAGADLSKEQPQDQSAEARGESVRNAMHDSFNPIIKKLAEMPFPTIAAVNGVAAGGGYGVALACDLVIAAKTADFILVFTPQLGLIPDLGASWHAPRHLGRAKAIAAAFFGDRMSAEQAVMEGLIWRCVEDDQLMSEAMSVAMKLADGPTKAFREVRRAFDAAYTHNLHQHLDYEADRQPVLIATEDYVEGVRAFIEKRKPVFKGR